MLVLVGAVVELPSAAETEKAPFGAKEFLYFCGREQKIPAVGWVIRTLSLHCLCWLY